MIDLSKVRNIGIAAHIDAGKTTTTERILYYTGRTHRMGEVDEGTTVTDFDEEEQKRGITIYSAAVTCPWRDFTINLIDTPGHVDFTAEVERSLRVLDGMVAVFDAREGVEAQSETVWKQADKYGVPRICFINKMDRTGADFEYSISNIRRRLSARPAVLQLPIGAGDEFAGLIDLLEFKAVYYQQEAKGSSFQIVDIPDQHRQRAEEARHALIETVAECSDTLMDKYLHDAPIQPHEIRAALRAAAIRRELTPLLCGSALRYIGVQRLLDAVCDYLPGPLEVPPVTAVDANKPGVEHRLPCDAKAPPAALVFKIVADKPLDLYYLRIYCGTFRPNMRLLNSATGQKENLSQIYRMFARRREQLDQAVAGEIVAVVGPKNALTGHTLCDARRPVVLEPIEFPVTVMSISVEPRSSKDRDKLLAALSALQRQDPTVSVKTDAETGQTLIAGMGELHLDILTQRLRKEMNVDVIVGRPRVTYRETIQAAAEGEGRFVRQLGGRNHFAVVRLRIEPRPYEKGRTTSQIVSHFPPDALPQEFVSAVEAGITEAAQSGVLSGYPVIDWKVTLLDVELDEKDSSAVAFENAARQAFYDAMAKAVPALLEPIMAVEIVTSETYLGPIMTDLHGRRATIRESRFRGSDRIIDADVPLAQLFGYITHLRSLSQGRATSTMAPSHYAPVPAEQMKTLVG